nr:MAG TPA: hypothetical protein [Caudoviricetes sp.]
MGAFYLKKRLLTPRAPKRYNRSVVFFRVEELWRKILVDLRPKVNYIVFSRWSTPANSETRQKEVVAPRYSSVPKKKEC